MADKRIERSDLVAPDAILSIVKDLEKMEDAQKNILEINKELLKTNAFNNVDDVKEFNKTVKSVNASTKALNETEKERLKLEKQIADSTDENVKAKLRLQKANKIQRDVLKDIIVLEDKEAGTLTKLTARNRQLRREREKLNLETKEGKDRLLDINKALNKNNKEIKENSDQLKKQKLNVGNYKDSVKEALEETNLFGISFSGLSDAFGKFASSPLAAVSSGLAALGGLYATSTSGAKDLRSATTRLSTTYGTFAEGLAKFVGADGKGGGLLDSLVKSLKQTLTGLPDVTGDIAVRATNALDQLRVTVRDSERLAKQQLDTAEELRQVRDDDQLTFAERTAANEKLLVVIEAREKQQLETQNEVLRNRRLLLALDKENVDLQLDVKDAEFELADIQEENEGFRSEALTNRNSLARDEIALTKESTKALETNTKAAKKQAEEAEKNRRAAEERKQKADEADAERRADAIFKREKEITDELEKDREQSFADRAEMANKELAEEERTSEERKRIREEELAANQRFAQQTLNAISESLDKASEKRIAKIEEEQDENEKAIERQERRAEQGLENNLAFEQQRAAELEKKREEEQKKAERRQKATLLFNSVAQFSKDDPNSALAKGIALTAATELVAGFFEDGAERIGDHTTGTANLPGRDNVIIGANKEERMFGIDDSLFIRSKLGNISNSDLIDLAINGANGSHVMAMGMNTAAIEQKLDRVEAAVKSSAINVQWDGLENRIETRVVNGITKKTTHKRGRI